MQIRNDMDKQTIPRTNPVACAISATSECVDINQTKSAQFSNHYTSTTEYKPFITRY